jgi:alkylation response protein AidB-like acyl-CoA dehydrogenase
VSYGALLISILISSTVRLNEVAVTVLQGTGQQTCRVGSFLLKMSLRSRTYQNPHSSPVAFLKSYSTSCGQDTARDAVQVFGGRGITQTGMGRHIEHYHRTIAFDALLGGGACSPVTSLCLSRLINVHHDLQRRMFCRIWEFGRRFGSCPRMRGCKDRPICGVMHYFIV